MFDIINAAEKGKLYRVRVLLCFHTDGIILCNALHRAVENNHIKCVKALLNAGATDKYNTLIKNFPICKAVKNRRADIVKVLLDANVRIPYYPLINTAIENNDIDIVHMLITANAPIQLWAYKHDELLTAAINNQYDIVEMLLEYGAEINHDVLSCMHALRSDICDLINRYLKEQVPQLRVLRYYHTQQCPICYDPCDTVYRCCHAPVHQECGQRWVHTVYLNRGNYFCYQRCDGDTI